jgi:hypothetical protein
MSLSIRPVTRRFPASFELWEETNLPLAVVLQPLDNTTSSSHEQQEEDIPAGSAAESSQRRQQSQSQLSSLPLLTHIPKCLHCGAPHPDVRTHYAPPPATRSYKHAPPPPPKWGGSSSSSSLHNSENNTHVLLCYLCGKLSSTRLDEQALARRRYEYEVDGVGVAQNAMFNQGVSEQEYYRRLPSQASHTFALPLRILHPSSSSSSSPSPSPTIAYQIPAMSCPPLWFWILDGTATDRSYWHVVSETLQKQMATLPPFCHVALLLAGRQDRGVGIYRLDSATPHVKYYPYAATSSLFASSSNSSTAARNNPVPSHAHNGQAKTTNGDHHIGAAAAANEKEAVLLLRQRIIQSLVPCDGSHRDHIHAALRSLLDVHSLVESDAILPHNNLFSSSLHSSTGMPLAELLTHVSEALLTFGQSADQKPPQQHENDRDLLLLDTAADGLLELDDILPYAGGKVTVFLANRPADLPHHAMPSYYNSYLASDDAARVLPLSSLYAYGGWGGRTASRGGGGGGGAGAVGGAYLPRMAPQDTTTVPFYSDTAAAAAAYADHHYLDEKDEQDLEQLADFFAELGRQFADAAMGVDILGLVSSLTNGVDNQDKDLGLTVVGGFCYKSGAPGPLLFDLHQAEARRNLIMEVASRSPWIAVNTNDSDKDVSQQHQRVFGAELRLRLSRGFTVDDAAIEPPPPSTSTDKSKKKKKKQVKQKQRFYDGFDDGNDKDDDQEGEDSLSQPFLACLHGEKGLMGPACAAPDEDSLWRMGTCDTHTAFSIDLDMAGSPGEKNTASTIPQDVMVDAWGRVPLKAVMQTCFAYTTIIKGKDGDDGEYFTVRRMKISSCPVPLAHDAETIYNAVDTEATAVVLFHKLSVAFFQEGLLATRTIATDWLQALLSCAYRSAETQAEIEFEMKESGIDKSTTATATAPLFFPSERLLHQDGGTLSDEDVLLAQGHARLRAFPRMIYLLLQCDAFRRHQELSSTTALSSNMDLRYAALYQMAHMTPGVLMRCIAPTLQLWSAASASATKNTRSQQQAQDDGDELILDMIDLRASAVHQAIKEYSNSSSSSSLILFMDTPYQILLLNAKAMLSTQENTICDGSRGRRQATPPAVPVVGHALAAAVQEAASRRYRTPPSMIRALDVSSSRTSEIATTRAVQHIWEACLEDVASEGDTFAQWKSKMAKQVHEELQDEDDDDYQYDGQV